MSNEDKIGVFVCHCGINISGTVDIDEVVKNIAEYPGVFHAQDYKYVCSEPGQKMICDAIREKGLTGVVIASCSPNLHEITFRNTVASAGLNPYLCEAANIREQCSWVHSDKTKATEKAIKIIKSLVEKVKLDDALIPTSVPVTRKCMVIGGGIAGMQAALDIANAGIKVILVEKKPSIGGHMAQLSETFPTLDCSQCILTPKMNEVGHDPNIELLTYAEVVEVDGYVGNFNVKVKKKPRYVDGNKCTACNKCSEVCPVVVHNEFDEGFGSRKAIYVPFPQAVPQTYVLDDQACLGLFPLACSKCMEACDPGAINYDQKPEYLDLKVGAIIVATGYNLLPEEHIGEYGYGKYADVITSLQFERLLSASGPTGGEVKRPSDRKVPKEIVFIQCAGSRDPEHGKPYCSKVCCMYTAKHALLYKHRVHDGQPYIFYIDIRSGGKGYEEFVQRAIDEEGIVYLRGKVSKVFQEGDKVIVWGTDTLAGKNIEIEADLVVLAMAIVPKDDAKDLAKMLRISTDEHGFMREAHIKLRPLETTTTGIYLAGATQAPKDIPDAVSQASGAASKVLVLLSGDSIELEPMKSEVIDENCDGCAYCIDPCPYNALTLIEYMRNGQVKKTVEASEALCQGCGVCQATCPKKGIFVRNFKLDQLSSMVDAILEVP